MQRPRGLSFVWPVWQVLWAVVLSSLQTALEILRAALQGHKGLRQRVGSRTHSSGVLESLHRVHALLHARADNGALGVVGGDHQDTMAFAAVGFGFDFGFGLVRVAGDRTTLQKVTAEAGCLRLCAVHSLALSTADARLQQYVLCAGRESKALTWEGMDRLFQTRWG
jgi:hypothetical protein